jgi:hypothetical protein
MLRKLISVAILPFAAMAQDASTEVKYDLRGLTYPRLAHLARVQGVVRLHLTPTETGQEIKLISGNALLVREPSDNLAKWRTNQPVTVNYIFRLTDPAIVKVRVPKGDAFDRLWLRMFHLATYTDQPHCESSPNISTSGPSVVQQSPMILEVETTATVPCLNTEASLVALR